MDKTISTAGQADVADELIATSDGFVIMARNRGPSDIFLFKINHSGDVLWAKSYDLQQMTTPFSMVERLPNLS